ncbi:hypothetical protein Rhopal_006015-T1 [Rhodotorula paludigena]|uniref:RRN7-type domain-containing protein n=1 Tax=Rhodotorula paludigena TaxID=86838 RepID=A0AAV5GTY9_9BASI|nr:hypothetical protein Rhopal_006015-T1 [Rhodotorula paludigena]
MARRPRCPVCRSRRWHRDALSGSIVCDEGHLLQGYVHETTETQDGPSQHTQHTRRLRKNRAKRERPPANAHFHGARDRFLVWQALQLVLREQLRVLIDDLGWPVELEPAARDLWALLVASSDVPPNPLDHARGDEPPGSYAGPRPGDRYTRAGRTPYGKRGVGNKAAGKRRPEAGDDDGDENAGGADAQNGDGAGAETTTAGETSADDGDDDDDDDESDADSYFSEADEADDERPRVGGPSRRNSPSAPASPAPGGAAASGTGQPQFNLFNPPKRRPMRAPRAPVVDDPRLQPRLEFTLLIIYLASMTLRLPVFLSDIFRLAESYQILYLDAASRLPAEMQEHLSKRSRDLLSPSYVPHLYTLSADLELLRAESVQAWLARLVSLYRDDWGVEFPEANVPLLLGRTCGLLALPPLAYTLTAHLLSLLPGPPSFHLPPSLTSRHPAPAQQAEPGKAPWPSVGKRLEGAQDWRTALPEIKVATLVVVVCRMLWRLEEDIAVGTEDEGESSAPPLLAEYAPCLAQRDDWLDAVEAIAALERPGDLQSLWSRDVVEMTGDEVDAYLDFFEAKMVNQDKLPRRMADISRFFPPPASDPSPLAPPSASSYLASLSHLTSSLHPFPPSQPPTSASSPSPFSAALPSIRPINPLSPLPSRSHSLASALPTPLHRLLAALASHLAPAPAAVHHKLAGAYPRDDERGAAGLAKLVEQVEWALEAAVPRTRGRPRAAAPTPAVDADVDDDAEPDEVPPPPKTRLDALRAEAEQRAVERRAKELEAKRASEQAYNRDRFYSDEDESSGRGGAAEETRMRRPRGVPTASRAGDVYWMVPPSATALAADALSSVAGTSDAGATGEDGEVEEWGRFKSSRYIEDSDDEAA